MWIRKTPEEIRKLELSRLKIFLGFFVFMFLVSFFCNKIMGDNVRFSAGGIPNPLKWNEVIDRIPIYLVISFILVFIGSKLDSNTKKREKNRYICDKCNKYNNSEEELCECGGRFVDIDKMKWIDNDDKIASPDMH
jgi:hypothetical protein